MKKVFSFIIMLMAVSSLWACEKKPAAVVNGEPITVEALQKTLQENVRRHGTEGAKVDTAALRKAVLEQMISETLLMQGALEANITVSDDEVNRRLNIMKARQGEAAFNKDLKSLGITEPDFVKLLREGMIKEKFIDSLLDKDPITEEQMREYYKNSPTPFIKPAESKLQFIQFIDKAKAEDAMKLIRDKKESFNSLADRMKKAEEGIVSDSAWISPRVFSTSIRDALKNMKTGSVHGPLEGRGGYYIFHLEERRPEGVKNYEEAKEDIRRTLRDDKKATIIIDWLMSKRKNSTIVIN